jgi:hypothetical protein
VKHQIENFITTCEKHDKDISEFLQNQENKVSENIEELKKVIEDNKPHSEALTKALHQMDARDFYGE